MIDVGGARGLAKRPVFGGGSAPSSYMSVSTQMEGRRSLEVVGIRTRRGGTSSGFTGPIGPVDPCSRFHLPGLLMVKKTSQSSLERGSGPAGAGASRETRKWPELGVRGGHRRMRVRGVMPGGGRRRMCESRSGWQNGPWRNLWLMKKQLTGQFEKNSVEAFAL